MVDFIQSLGPLVNLVYYLMLDLGVLDKISNLLIFFREDRDFLCFQFSHTKIPVENYF